jgi:hypothetical protein
MNNLLLNNTAKGPGAKIYFCKVIRFLPSSNTADVVTVDNNISLLGCNIACSMPAGFAYGTRYIPTHDDQNSEVEYVNSAGDIYCVAAFLENDYNNSAILGFLFPMQTTLSIAEYGLYIFRHESDVMWMVRGDGTMQVYHPSGSIIKIGDTDINEMTDTIDEAGLYPAKTDGMYIRSAPDYNTEKETNLFIKWHAGQTIELNNDGNLTISTRDNASVLTMSPEGVLNVETTSDISIKSATKATIEAPEIDVNSTIKTNITTAELDIDSTPGVTGTHSHAGMTITTVKGIVTAIS